MKPIPAETTHTIISKLKEGKSRRHIAAKVGVSKSTVDRICSSLELPPSPCPRGRPRKLTDYDVRHLCHEVLSGGLKNAAQLKRSLQ
ncbi:hypothetical protein CPB86DRAFT_669925, partial [Serendipita vermifera]